MSTNPQAVPPWEQLFPPPAEATRSVTLQMRLLRKHGEPLLLLPATGRTTHAALSLYPAQSWKAKVARGGLRLTGMVGWLPGTTPVALRIDPQAAFAKFLAPPGLSAQALSFALLLGNPHAAGRRYVLLVCDAAGQPIRVVKAGEGNGRAVELIQSEAAFRQAAPATLLSAPALHGRFHDGEVAALSMDYAAGTTPRCDEFEPAARLLESWIDRSRTVPFAALAVAQRLEANARTDEVTRRALTAMRRLEFHPTIHHGDFAPWNIRVDATGRWQVLDWERGELAGPPAWDWFHYLIQPEVLVRRTQPAEILAKVQRFLHSEHFTRYTAQAGIASCVAELLLGYLIYCRDVTRQTEGMPVVEALVAGCPLPPPA
ncbi:MAG: hypothetical protein RLY20_1229 [Verrucomicrobiota bacterium]|jgi:hypothetical protein